MMILMPNGSGGLFPIFFPDNNDGGDGPNVPKWVVILWLILGVIGSLLCTYLIYLALLAHDWLFWVMTTIFFFSWIFLGPLSFLVAFIIWITL